MPTFQFADWPHSLSEDLRILKRRESEAGNFCIVYSIAMDAYTQVQSEQVEQLKAEGVREVTSIEAGIGDVPS